MRVPNPYLRICRPYLSGQYPTLEDSYLLDPRYASDRVDLTRSYHLLERELYRIFDFVEPADANLACYSHEIYALLLRAATEFEANSKAILRANGYVRPGGANWNVVDYAKLNAAMRLDEYLVSIPVWNGTWRTFKPLTEWSQGHTLNWYKDYNSVKHDRFGNFASATLENAIKAVASVYCLLFAQFHIHVFDPHHPVEEYSASDATGELSHDACMLAITPPTSWTAAERYDFSWSALKALPNPFQQFSF
jgi:hypothetical protein